MSHDERMEKAINAIESGEAKNYSEAARKYNVERSTLSRRHREKTRSRSQFLPESIQCLTAEQEETLISLINRMTNRGMPLRSQIVRNLAEEMIGREVHKN